MTLAQHLLLYGIMAVIVFFGCVVIHFRFFGNRDLNLNLSVVIVGGIGVGTGLTVFIAGLVLAIWTYIQRAF